MHKPRIGVIGTGHLGSIHAKLYKEIPLCSLEAVCDTNPAVLNQISRSLNTPGFTDYRRLFDKVDAVSIAVPTNLHYKVALDFLNQGKHILIEKPFTTNLIQADTLIKLAHSKKLVLQVGHIERFNSAFNATLKFINQPKFIECHRLSPFPNRSLDVGVVLDLMIHDIDIVLGLVGDGPAPTFPLGQSRSRSGQARPIIKKIESVGINVLTRFEDIANVRITFANNCVANLTASRISDETMRKIRIFQKNTYISLDYKEAKATVYKKTGNTIIKQDLPIEKEQPLQKELLSFIDCILNHKQPVVSGRVGRDALAVALKIQNQIWENNKSAS